MTDTTERVAIQKITKSILEGNIGKHCQADKDLIIKYLLQKCLDLENRIHLLEVRRIGFGHPE